MDGLMQLIDKHGAELSQMAKTKEESAAEQAELMARMKDQRNKLSSGMSKIMKAMMGLTGKDVEGFLQSKEVDKYLVEAFNQYDVNGNGTLSYREFGDAWKYMNLGGSESDIKAAFSSVDVDYSGVVKYVEFASAI